MLAYDALAVNVGEASAYVTAGGLAGWPAGEPERSAALMRGQRYIAREYNDRWDIVFANDAAPELVKFAIIEAAVIEARTPGLLSRVATPSEAKVLTGVGSLRWTPVQMPGGEDALRPRITHVDAMLEPIASRGLRPAALVV